MNTIKVGFCVAYDWHLLQIALPLIYNDADDICLTLDKDRISWSGKSFSFDSPAFYKMIDELDYQKKIRIIEEDYHLPELSPMQNEVRQRNIMARHLGAGGWHVQLDCDEYLLQFTEFVSYLKSLPSNKTKAANVCCPWVVLFKQLPSGCLIVNPTSKKNIEWIQVATTEPNYEYGRRNGNFNLYTNFPLLHQSWARTAEEIKEKVENWGHSKDFDPKHFMIFWNQLDQFNYKQAKNFHPYKPETYPELSYLSGTSIREIITQFKGMNNVHYTPFDLKLKNSKTISRVKKALGYFWK